MYDIVFVRSSFIDPPRAVYFRNFRLTSKNRHTACIPRISSVKTALNCLENNLYDNTGFTGKRKRFGYSFSTWKDRVCQKTQLSTYLDAIRSKKCPCTSAPNSWKLRFLSKWNLVILIISSFRSILQWKTLKSVQNWLHNCKSKTDIQPKLNRAHPSLK